MLYNLQIWRCFAPTPTPTATVRQCDTVGVSSSRAVFNMRTKPISSTHSTHRHRLCQCESAATWLARANEQLMNFHAPRSFCVFCCFYLRLLSDPRLLFSTMRFNRSRYSGNWLALQPFFLFFIFSVILNLRKTIKKLHNVLNASQPEPEPESEWRSCKSINWARFRAPEEVKLTSELGERLVAF